MALRHIKLVKLEDSLRLYRRLEAASETWVTAKGVNRIWRSRGYIGVTVEKAFGC